MVEEDKKSNSSGAISVDGVQPPTVTESTGGNSQGQSGASNGATTPPVASGVTAVSADGEKVTASKTTADAENVAQTAANNATNVTKQADGVKVVEGTPSASNVQTKVTAAQSDAAAAGAYADWNWDKDAIRGTQSYKDVFNFYNGITDKSQAKRVVEMFKGANYKSEDLNDEQRALLQYCDDVINDEVSVHANQQNTEQQHVTGVESSAPKHNVAPEVNMKGVNGKSAKETIEELGYTGEGEKRHPVHIEWSPSNANDAVVKEISDATDEYTKAIEEARRAKDEALAKVMDSTSSITDKADAIEAMAASDEIIRRYSNPDYVKRRKASKVIGMIADAFASLGNMLTAVKGGVPSKFDSASDKVRKAEKEEEAALQKRVDYWTKKMESARDSDLRSSNFLRSRNITAALEDFRISSSKAKDILNSRKALAKEYGARQAASDKEQLRIVNEHNKKADAYQKGVDDDKRYEKRRKEKNEDFTSHLYQQEQSSNRRAKYNNSLPSKKKGSGGGIHLSFGSNEQQD